jgi:DNA-binding NarL/FixJ family response regulator
MPLNVLIIEDHPLIQEVLRQIFQREPGFAVCGLVATAEAGLERLSEVAADVVLVDLSLPDVNGIDLIREIVGRWEGLPCLVFSGHAETFYIQRAREAGARGYVLKGNPFELPDAVRQVALGGSHFGDVANG